MPTFTQQRTLPMSLRSESGEHVYQKAKRNRGLIPLSSEKVITRWTHWKLIENRFPYDMCFSKCDMLIPIKEVADYDDLPETAKRELREIITYYCQEKYDVVFENMNKRRSVKNLYHLHCATYVKNRSDVCL